MLSRWVKSHCTPEQSEDRIVANVGVEPLPSAIQVAADLRKGRRSSRVRDRVCEDPKGEREETSYPLDLSGSANRLQVHRPDRLFQDQSCLVHAELHQNPRTSEMQSVAEQRMK